ncbi:hypothetical protein DM02DRAFT_409820 [Periconia macrospinosa]|uniref:Uncharacterized protein n=1 Tax=Periconia macrospinosa TaxID=97972 RepID=A0A2V1DPJ4_9PLEO|nr:hypothetical protein DM02DRAFT_409820 [Periconia macrospinosa]
MTSVRVAVSIHGQGKVITLTSIGSPVDESITGTILICKCNGKHAPPTQRLKIRRPTNSILFLFFFFSWPCVQVSHATTVSVQEHLR